MRYFNRKSMEASSCLHVERLKQRGGIRDYEKFLLNLTYDCPDHLSRTRKNLSTLKVRRIGCQKVGCTENLSDCRMFSCLHCIYISCRKHARAHFKRENHPIGCIMADGAVFCFSCSDFIFDASFEGMRETVQSGRSSLGGNIMHFPNVIQNVMSDVMCIKPNSTVGLRGLVNLSNTCFMSSIIQVLVHTPILTEFFLGELGDVDCSNDHDNKPCLMNVMSNIFRKFYSGEKTPIVMPDLLEKIWMNAPHLATADQHDAHEFLAAVLEALNRHFESSNTPSPIEGILHGRLKSTVKCMVCGNKSVTKEPFMDISLEVFGHSSITLKECLNRYTQVEKLGPSHTTHCITCEKQQESSKQLQLQKVPLILCLHFKRFMNLNENKWEHLIEFPMHFNLSEFTTIQGNSKRRHSNSFKRSLELLEHNYMLYAVVTHTGSSSGGHYYTYIRNTHDTWFECDDHLLTKAELSQVLSCQAYMLFYHREKIPEKVSYSSPYHSSD